jgi:hypothetical protein
LHVIRKRVRTLSAQTAVPSAPPATPAEPMIYAPQPTPASEDWSTISLAKSGLPLGATGGVLLSKIEQPDCTRELLRLQQLLRAEPDHRA